VSGIIAAVVTTRSDRRGGELPLHCWKIFDDPSPEATRRFSVEFYSQRWRALDTDIKIINLSIGGTERSKTEATIFRQLMDDGVIVAAMGNDSKRNPRVSGQL
jgi:hypothetical protein